MAECYRKELAREIAKIFCSKGQPFPLRVVVHPESHMSSLAGNAVYAGWVHQGPSQA